MKINEEKKDPIQVAVITILFKYIKIWMCVCVCVHKYIYSPGINFTKIYEDPHEGKSKILPRYIKGKYMYNNVTIGNNTILYT